MGNEMKRTPEYLKDWRAHANKASWAVYDNTGARICTINSDFMGQAEIANLIARAPDLLADNARLIEALRPFAAFMEVADAVHPKGSYQIVLRSDSRTREVVKLTYAQIEQASAALKSCGEV